MRRVVALNVSHQTLIWQQGLCETCSVFEFVVSDLRSGISVSRKGCCVCVQVGGGDSVATVCDVESLKSNE